MLSVKKTTMHFKETIRLGILTRPHIYIRYRKFLLFIKKRQLEKKKVTMETCALNFHILQIGKEGKKDKCSSLPRLLPSPLLLLF